MRQAVGRSAPRGLPALALLAVLLPPSLLAWRLLHFPGWDLTDEAWTLSLWQRMHEGLGQSWLATRGCLHRALVEGILSLAGWRFGATRAAAVAIYGVEAAALLGLARRHLGPAAAWGALLASTAAALPAIHLGSLISPQMQPLTWTLAAWAALALDRPWQALLWGAACGAACLDYEGWLVALPGLWLLLALRPRRGPRLGWAAVGFVLVAGAVAWHSAPSFQAYAQGRRAYSDPGHWTHAGDLMLLHLREFFWGGSQALPTQGVPGGAAQYPLWALPFLVLALVRVWVVRDALRPLRAALWACALIPFSVFILSAPAIPSQRVLASWPALALLAGESLAWVWGRGRAWAVAVALLALLGGAWEAHAFITGMQVQGARFYGGGGALLKAAQRLRTVPSLELFSELDAAPRGDLRLALGRRDQDLRAGTPVALIPWQSALSLAKGKGRWEVFPSGPAQAPCLLYWPAPAEVATFREAHARLKAFWDAERDEFYGTVYRDLVAATSQPIANPWVRDALWEARFLHARRIGHPEPAEGEWALRLGLLRVDPLLRQARDQLYSDPAEAEHLLRIALERDPRRREGWRELRQLMIVQHREKDLKMLDKRIDALKGPSYEPFWLEE